MEPGWPFLFKLHSPRNYIVGGGFFVRFTVLPCFLAWDAFDEKNGTASLAELVARTAHYRKAPQTPGTPIGCNVLTEPFFLDEDDWIPVPPDWPRNVQRGFTYDTDTAPGDALWQAIEDRLVAHRLADAALFRISSCTQGRSAPASSRRINPLRCVPTSASQAPSFG